MGNCLALSRGPARGPLQNLKCGRALVGCAAWWAAWGLKVASPCQVSVGHGRRMPWRACPGGIGIRLLSQGLELGAIASRFGIIATASLVGLELSEPKSWQIGATTRYSSALAQGGSINGGARLDLLSFCEKADLVAVPGRTYQFGVWGVLFWVLRHFRV